MQEICPVNRLVKIENRIQDRILLFKINVHRKIIELGRLLSWYSTCWRRINILSSIIRNYIKWSTVVVCTCDMICDMIKQK